MIWTKPGPHADPQWFLVPVINELLLPNNECPSVFIVIIVLIFFIWKLLTDTKTRSFSKVLNKLVKTFTGIVYLNLDNLFNEDYVF